MDDSTGDGSSSELSPAARQGKPAAASVMCDGVTFTLTEGNELAEVARDGAARVLDSESFVLDAGTGTRLHIVDVQGEAEAMLFLVSVREDQRRIVAVCRFS